MLVCILPDKCSEVTPMGTSGYQHRPDEGPTIKQLRFIHDLGGDLVKAIYMHSWRDASHYIEDLKRNRPSPVVAPVTVTTPVVMVSDRQLEYIKTLGGDLTHAAKLTRAQASEYIQELRSKPKEETAPAAPLSTAKSTDPRLDLLNGLLEGVRDGYYAVQSDDSDPLTFLRVSRPKSGQFEGSVKIQTQHSEELKLAACKWKSGYWSVYRKSVIDRLLILVLDPTKAGMKYAQELGHCLRCNKELTDERSRFYGIGPECEKVLPNHINWVNEQHNGLPYETLKARSML